MHDREKDYNGIAPYRNVEFKSIYQGCTVEMHIVNHCNLNCAGCNHFSPLAKPWFIEVEDFKSQVISLKEHITSLKEFLILGGEPTLHPKFVEICKIAREILGKEVRIIVLSNGTVFNTYENNIQELSQSGIILSYCSYPNTTNHKKIYELNKKGLETTYFNTRHISHQTLLDPEGKQDERQFFRCGEHKLPCLTLRDYKIFICPFTAHRHLCEEAMGITIPLIEGKDYLNLNDITDLDILQDFCFEQKPSCKYCNQTNNFWLWQKSRRDIIEYTIPLNELYYIDYQRYYDIVNNHFEGFIECCKPENPMPIDLNYAYTEVENTITRLGVGKMDIIIPHYNINEKLAGRLINSLLKQTIIKDCTIYLISDNSPNEKILIDKISETELSYVLLKTPSNEGPGAARNLGIENSFNNFLLFFDADDYFCSDTALEDLYNKMSEGYEVIDFMMYPDIQIDSNKTACLCRRDYLNKYNIRYEKLYFGEDMIFQSELFKYTDNIFHYDNNSNIFAVYDRSNPDSLSNNFSLVDTEHFNFVVSRVLSLNENIKPDQYKILLSSINQIVKDNRIIFSKDFNKVLVYWIKHQFYLNNPELYTSLSRNENEVLDFQNKQYYIATSDKILTSIPEIEKYLRKNLKKKLLLKYKTGAAVNLLNKLKEGQNNEL